MTIMCKVLKVNASSYYHWSRTGCIVEKVDEELNKLIKGAFKAGRETYGQRRIKEALLNKHGLIVSKRRVGHIMKSLNFMPKMFKTRAKANEMIFEYIEVFYNRQRMHSSNNYLSPIEFEEKMLRIEMVA